MPLDLSNMSAELFERYNLILRLALAAALGGMIGLEREHSGKPAGFRTNMLICMGAALITEISYITAFNAHAELGINADPGRIAAQIVSGIGFLGAGTIIHARGTVQGLTTAATLWVVAAIGMAVGARGYTAAVIATGLVMLALMILGRVEDHLIPRKPSERNVEVTIKAPADTGTVEQALVTAGFMVDTLSVRKENDRFYATYQLRGDAKYWEPAVRKLVALDGVEKVEVA